MDVNTPVTNPKLLTAIQVMKDDNSMKSQFFDELFNAMFLCPTQMNLRNVIKNEDDSIRLGNDANFFLLCIEDNSNKSYLMAFTDWDELRKWKDDTG